MVVLEAVADDGQQPPRDPTVAVEYIVVQMNVAVRHVEERARSHTSMALFIGGDDRHTLLCEILPLGIREEGLVVVHDGAARPTLLVHKEKDKSKLVL